MRSMLAYHIPRLFLFAAIGTAILIPFVGLKPELLIVFMVSGFCYKMGTMSQIFYGERHGYFPFGDDDREEPEHE